MQSERRYASLSSLDHRITVLFYIFSVVNTFMGNVIGSTIVQNIGAMLKQPGALLRCFLLAAPMHAPLPVPVGCYPSTPSGQVRQEAVQLATVRTGAGNLLSLPHPRTLPLAARRPHCRPVAHAAGPLTSFLLKLLCELRNHPRPLHQCIPVCLVRSQTTDLLPAACLTSSAAYMPGAAHPKPAGSVLALHHSACCPHATCRPHDGTVLFVLFRAVGLFRKRRL